jgi:hypothetical protein
MIQKEPGNRLNLADILGHSWLKGVTATHEEAQMEFTQRK